MAYRKMTQDKMTNGIIPEGVYKASEDIEVFRIGKRKKDKGKGYHPCILRCVVPKGALIVKPICYGSDLYKMRTNKLLTKSISKVDVVWKKTGPTMTGVSPNVRYSKCTSPVYSYLGLTFEVGKLAEPYPCLNQDISEDCESGIYLYRDKETCEEQLRLMLLDRDFIFKG